ncbi:hypothetical protein E3P96_02598 [Wallemia ichthyophaga]|nr:hypothetical protein E3P96_02598 [Wallemia ichthyophaga]
MIFSSNDRSRDIRTLGFLSLACFLYGWSVSSIGSVQNAAICQTGDVTRNRLECLNISDTSYSFAVGPFFAAGGLVGSLVISPYLGNRVGWTNLSRVAFSGFFSLIGQVIIAITPFASLLFVGRLLSGISAGVAIVAVPIELERMKDSEDSYLGLLTQISIVTGLTVSQALSLALAKPTYWRLMPMIAGLISGIQLLLHRRYSPLPTEDYEENDEVVPQLSMLDVLKDREMRPKLIKAVVLLASQQFAAINIILFYSKMIFNSDLISMLITLVNFFMTFLTLLILNMLSKRSLFNVSYFGAIVSLGILSLSLERNYMVTSIVIYVYIASYSIGLGPLPFDILGQLSTEETKNSLSSIGLSVNWITNMIMSAGFSILQLLLMSYGDDLNDGLDYNFDNIESENEGSFVDEEFAAGDDNEESLQLATGQKRVRDDVEQPQQKKKKTKKTKHWSSQVPQVAKSAQSSQYDFLKDQLKSVYGKLSDIEIEERVIPETAIDATHEYSLPRNKDTITDFISTQFSNLKDSLSKPNKQKGSPRLLVICSSAIRCADVVRSLKQLNPSKDIPIAKLFAKHIKLHEQKDFLQSNQTVIAVATPNRAKSLIEDGTLNTKYLSLILLDSSYTDDKQRTLFDVPETKTQLFDLLNLKSIYERFKGEIGGQGDKGRKTALCLF